MSFVLPSFSNLINAKQGKQIPIRKKVNKKILSLTKGFLLPREFIYYNFWLHATHFVSCSKSLKIISRLSFIWHSIAVP